MLLAGAWLQPAGGDEIRPGYLGLSETGDDTYAVVWKVPRAGGAEAVMRPVFPDDCRAVTPTATYPGKYTNQQRWTVECRQGLRDKALSFTGLRETLTEILVQVEWRDGASQIVRAGPGQPDVMLRGPSTRTEVALTYTGIGIEHILGGIDHLLFVLALLIIVDGIGRLVATVTAFTLAHSLTLAAATLGYARLPQQPVEAVIALSIVFLAAEIVHAERGHPGAAHRWPWLVAFTFGLLHGFGFAGALAEIGLPEHAIPLALVFFNVGVEIGQLAFVAGFIVLSWLINKLPLPAFGRIRLFVTYAIGSVAAYWVFDRIFSFWV